MTDRHTRYTGNQGVRRGMGTALVSGIGGMKMRINWVCQCDSCKIVRENHKIEMDRQRNTAYGSRDDWFADNKRAWDALRANLCKIEG